MKWETHPSLMEDDNGKLRLNVLEYLKPDLTLPKYLSGEKLVKKGDKTMTIEEYMNEPDGMSSYRRASTGYKISKKESFGQRLSKRFSKWFKSAFRPSVYPTESFSMAHDMIENNVISSDIGETAVKLKNLVEKCKFNGQFALARRMENEYESILKEIVLVKNGLFKYMNEDDVIELLQKADFGIRIDFWNDYAEFTPDEVLEVKRKADALCVFDNWCVMHFDPEGTALKQMKAEEIARDPILFGMIMGSDRLYYVKDWVTPTDAVTVKKICEILGVEKLRDKREYGTESTFRNAFMSNDSVFMTPDTDPIDPEQSEWGSR